MAESPQSLVMRSLDSYRVSIKPADAGKTLWLVTIKARYLGAPVVGRGTGETAEAAYVNAVAAVEERRAFIESRKVPERTP